MNNKQKLSFICNQKWVIFAALLFMQMSSTAFAQDIQVKIGVLALRGYEESMKRWMRH